MILSICIPTYNRGHRAKQLVSHLLSLPIEYDMEIIVSDNGSTKYTEDYKQIALIGDPRLHYHRNDENKGFMMNLNQVIRISHGEYCMIISDEDDVDERYLDEYINILKTIDNISVMKAGTSKSYNNQSYIVASSCHDAIENFYLVGNYVSGVFYNRKIITNELVDSYEKKYVNNTAYIHYPHMFYDAVAVTRGTLVKGDKILILEGESEADNVLPLDGKTAGTYTTYENRIQQMEGFFLHIKDLNVAAGEKFHMFEKVCNKYCYLLWLVHRVVKDSDEELSEQLEIAKPIMKKALRMYDIPLKPEEIAEVDDYIDSMANYMNVLEHNGCFG